MAKGFSLHIGLNKVDPAHYAGWSGPLTACEADAEDMQALAARLAYKTNLLKTARATRKAVTEAIGEAAAGLGPGDTFFLTYSGHGGQLPDRSGDERDMMDETWCLFDAQLVDDELFQLWSKFAKGARIIVLSDSCHSGTVTRVVERTAGGGYDIASVELRTGGPESADARFRVAPRDVILRTYRSNQSFYDRIVDELPKEVPAPTATVRLISGCQDNQLSRDGTFNGLFTGTLLRVWNDGKFQGNYRDFHAGILRKMPSDQSPNHYVIGAANAAFDGERPFTIG